MGLCTKAKILVFANEVQEEGRGSKPPSGSHRPATPAEIRLEPQRFCAKGKIAETRGRKLNAV